MSGKLLHLRNATAGKVPQAAELVAGQIAINTTDKKLFILASDGTVATFASSSGAVVGTVTSVNSKSPNGSGAVTLVPSDLGASTVGSSVFTATSATTARAALGSGTVGDSLFTATSASGALTILGASTVGSAVFAASTAASAVTSLGATAVGSGLFTASSAAAALALIGAVATTSINAANGVAPLDANAKIPTANLPDAILGGVNFQGMFIPGTTTLPAAASGNKGYYYIASANGTYTPPSGTLLTFSVGDWIISEGATGWTTVDTSDAVASVNGKTGVVTIVASDITSGTFASAQLGASAGNNLVLTTGSTGLPTWLATVPAANLPVASTTQLGLAEAGTGLLSAGGVFSVDTTVLTVDEGSYTGS